MRIAIVGTGISGLVCAHLLHPRHDITVFEAGDHVGGHTNTVRVDLEGETHHVDTGFIVHNERNYPNFVELMNQLGVATQPSTMSFSVSDPRTGLEYRGTNLNTIFAQRRNLVRPSFLRMLADIVRFNRAAKRLLREANGTDESVSLEQFVRDGDYSPAFTDQFLVPLGASIWSADPETFTQFPAVAYARFMDNHGLLDLRGMPEWRTVTGGSQRYVDRITAPFAERIRLRDPVEKVVRTPDGVEVVSVLDGPEVFDRVILASHSDQALRLLADPSPAEREILGAIRYQPNVATLHTDERFLPRSPRARASWNYHLSGDGGRTATLTYWMNRLQSIESRHQFLVTLNRHEDIDPDKVLGRYDYTHPVFDAGAMAAQRRRDEIQGVRGTFFAGAYWEYGFHEDGVRSALDVCRHFGVAL
ncbi:MAG TPA: FAD-dependent oxidoreductase [Acidimicrobiales bacterium]|nr:FAD-dependent oxidoreductase [Acidimicrobiales bacterium]